MIILLACSVLSADGIRYMDEVFESVQKTENVVYGNAPDLPFWFWVESNTVDIDLDMDVYEPEGDTLTNRPVIVFVHTGSFFSGHNELDDVVDLSISAAKRGYVAISINYRLGLNIISTYSGERAVYRAVQDGGAAIRYLREFPEEFGINPDQIFMWGTSAGAIVALHLSYLDNDDRPDATYGGRGDPDLGCPICEGNDYVHDPKPNAIVSCWGAIGDLDWIDADDTVPAIMFHGTADPIVPFNSGFPFTLDIALPIVYGSNLIHDRLYELGIEHELHAESGLLHEYWGTVNGNWFGGPNEYFYQIQTDAYSFLYNYLDCAQQDPLSLCLVAEGGLNEVLLQWVPNTFAESYNISRDGQFVGNIPAKDIVEKMEILHQDDPKLEEATKEIYSKEFYEGILGDNTKQFAGKKISEAKDVIKEWITKTGSADILLELTNSPVRCRCGTECVVKLLSNQWFLDYSNKDWKQKAHSCFEGMNILPNEIRSEFDKVLDWLRERACARQHGLGTKVPWDKEWLVESLADSVIYMAFYIISKYVNKKEINGNDLTDEFFDYVFYGKKDSGEIANKINITKEKLEEIRNEFLYFYPVDSRHSGRDLVPNHLTFFVLNHVALFPEENWPQEIVVNGSVLMAGKKMSKSM